MHDIDPRRLELAHDLAQIAIERHGRPARVRSEPDRRRALAGADFAINAVNIGGHAATVTDFDVPARYGLRQTIADTLGVGGVFRGLRTFPFLDAVATDMQAVCPDAWLLNYTNPMAMNIEFLARTHPGLNVLGLCHSVYWTVHDLSELIGVPLDEVSFSSAGVNHQAWVLQWERDGQDLYPLLDERIAADPELRRRVRVDMYRRLGFYPTETSEHSSEYVPWYLHDDREIERLRIPVGTTCRSAPTMSRRSRPDPAGGCRRIRRAGRRRHGIRPPGVHSMVTGTPRTIQANVANAGLIDNLPQGAGIEVPCRMDGAGAHPLPVGALPPQCAALNRAFLNVVELTVRAAVDGDPHHVRHALLADPNTAATLSVEDIYALADDMVAAHRELLPEALRASRPGRRARSGRGARVGRRPSGSPGRR